MSWADDYYAGTYETTTSSLGASWYYYVKKFLETTKEHVRLVPLGQKVPLPEGNGKTVVMHRYNSLARSISSATLTEGVMPNATQYTMQQLSAAVVEYGAWVQDTTLLRQITIDQSRDGLTEIIAAHAAEIIDMLCHREIGSNGGYPLRADYAVDTGATYKGTVTTSTSTTVFADSALAGNTDYGDANDDLNQSTLIFLTGTAAGQCRAVNDYATSGGVITVSPALDVKPAVGDTFVVTTWDSIASGDKLTYENAKRAVTILRANKATPVDNGYFVAVADPYQLELLMDDTVWKGVETYKDQTDGIFKGEVGKFCGVRYIEETNPFKFPITTRGTSGTSYGPGASGANQTETGSGLVTLVPYFGRNAFGVTTFSKKNANNPPLYFKTADQLGQPIPRFGSVGWMLEFVAKALQPKFCVNVGLYDAS